MARQSLFKRKHSALERLVFLLVTSVLACLVASRAFAATPSDELELKLAAPILPILKAEISKHWPTAPFAVLAGQASHESACPIPRKCWNPRVEFNTTRERGAGILQITKVYGRFDALAELRAKHPSLKDWNWETTLSDPTYQMRGLVLKSRDNYSLMTFAPQEQERIAFAVTAFNSGVGGVYKDRAYCRNTPGCDPTMWFNHVQNTCTASKTKLPGYGLTFCQIRGKYAADILFNRAPKYEGLK